MYSPLRQQGFTAVILIIVITALLAIVVLSSLQVSTAQIQQSSVALRGSQAFEAASYCTEEALLNFSSAPSYGGGQTLTVGSNTCTIDTVTTLGNGHKQLVTRSTVGGSTRVMTIELQLSPLQVVTASVQ